MKRYAQAPLEVRIAIAVRRSRILAGSASVPIKRTLELLGASNPGKMMLERWRRELGHLRVETSVETWLQTCVGRYNFLRDRLPKQTESREARQRRWEPSGTHCSSAIGSCTGSGAVTIVCKGYETRQYQIHLFPRPCPLCLFGPIQRSRG